MSDTIQTIRKATKHFFSGTLLSRVAGMGRDMVMAYSFGTHASIASFMVAFRFAHLLRRLFGEGALQSAFVPEFEHLRHQNPKEAFSFFRNLFILLTLFLSVLIFVGEVFLGALLVWGNFSESNHEILSLLFLMLPSLLFICLYGFNSSILQCEKIYFIPSVAPVIFNLVWIFTLLGLNLTTLSESQAMPILSVGVIIGCICQWLFTIPPLIKILKKELPHKLWREIQLYGPEMKRMGQALFLGMIGTAAFQVNNAIDALFARYAELEGPALLWYAIRLHQLPLALFGIGISGALLPPLSRAIKAANWDKYYEFLHFAFQQTLSMMIPLTAILFVMGDTSVNLVYGRGLFNSSSILGTTHCLWAYGLGLLPTTFILILAPACYAQKNYRLPTYASFLTIFVNCVLNSLFIIGLGFGAVSVAIATSISSWLNVFFLFLALSKERSLFPKALGLYTCRIIAVSLIASIGTLWLKSFQTTPSLYMLLFESDLSFPTEFSQQCLYFAVQFLCFCGLWGGTNFCINQYGRFSNKIIPNSGL